MRAKKHISMLTASVLALTLLSACGESLADAETEDYRVSDVAAETEPASTLNAEADVAGAMDTALELLTDVATTQYFTDDAVEEGDIDTILDAGINAPSAMNGQKWHFSAITDKEVLEQIAADMAAGTVTGTSGSDNGTQSKAGIADAPLAIVVSCASGSEFDAGLACQSMSSAAILLGYGTKIISSPTIVLNGENQDEYRELLGIPEGYSAVAVLLVGYADEDVDESADGYTGATERNSAEDMATYVQ